MTINYVLYENNLTSDPGDYIARVLSVDSADLEAVIERMIQRGSTVTRADIVGVMEDYYGALESMLLEGVNVNTPGANFSVSIKGVFNGPTDSFDPSRHQVMLVVNPGKRLRSAVQGQAQVAKGESLLPRPNPVEYHDVASGERNSLLTPGGFGKLSGHRLKFDPADPAQGIFFVDADGSAARVAMVGQNKPAELMFIVPALAAGDYTLEVRAALGEGEVRRGSLVAALTVA